MSQTTVAVRSLDSDSAAAESSAMTSVPERFRRAVRARPRNPCAPVTSTEFGCRIVMASRESAQLRCFLLRHTASNSPTSAIARGIAPWYAQVALRSGSHLVSGDSDQQFTSAVAHSRGAFATRTRINGGARVFRNLAPHV